NFERFTSFLSSASTFLSLLAKNNRSLINLFISSASAFTSSRTSRPNALRFLFLHALTGQWSYKKYLMEFGVYVKHPIQIFPACKLYYTFVFFYNSCFYHLSNENKY